ncbi:hypothetical protein [Phreatobacter sp.]|uniref:hypothetical protein n=1 Tax=Phreatobacter sp. TaxID=1966341 RepID=UPI0025E20B53|nr:hypothetical protein [Phreatobacter sp.]
MNIVRTSIAAGILGACFIVLPASAQTIPQRDPAVAGALAAITPDGQVEMQGRRGGGFRTGGGGVRAGGGGGGRGGFRGGGGRGGFRGGGGRGGFGGGGGAGAAAVAIGILGAAIIASEAARARAPRDCWIERQRVRDEWGRTIGFRRVRICN